MTGRTLSGLRAAALAGMTTAALLAGGRLAAAAEPAPKDDGVIYTRAEVRSFFQESDGRYYVRLKLLPRAKIPFTTQNFLVADRALLEGIGEGASVRFTASHVAGENTLTSIQKAPPCVRFQKCD